MRNLTWILRGGHGWTGWGWGRNFYAEGGRFGEGVYEFLSKKGLSYFCWLRGGGGRKGVRYSSVITTLDPALDGSPRIKC